MKVESRFRICDN